MSETARLPYHPLAGLLPMMSAAEREELKAAIARDGQRRPIVADSEGIIDGRNRYEVCLELGLTPRLRAYDPRPAPAGDGPDRLAFVLAENVERRHLNESQRAMVAARLATMRQGERTDLAQQQPSANLPKVDQASAAKMLGVSDRSLRDAKVVQDKGTAELRLAVDSGQLAVSAAKQAASLPEAQQREIAAAAAAGETNAARTTVKKHARAAREAKLGGEIAALPEEKYGFIFADPEHRFEPFSRETGMDRAADNHYPTSDRDDLAARRALIDRIAAEHCVLALWVTDLAAGVDLMRDWCFTPKSRYAWLKNLKECTDLSDADKAKIGLEGRRVFIYVGAAGTGYWGRDEIEFCLIGTRGNPVCPAMGEQGGNVWIEPKRAHSEKPECSFAWADKHFANTPRIELNARHRRPGWQAWGDEVTPGKPDIIALEREALVLGLIHPDGMVQTSPTSLVAFEFVTEAEWRVLLQPTIRLSSFTILPDPDQASLDNPQADPQLADVITPVNGPLDIPPFLQRAS